MAEQKIVYRHPLNGSNDGFLKSTEIKIGRTYLMKDGRVVLYLGKDRNEYFNFYLFGQALLIGQALLKEKMVGVTFANYKPQIAGLICIVQNSLSAPVDLTCIFVLKSFPMIHGEIPFLNLENQYNNWFAKSKALNPGSIPNLTINDTDAPKTSYVPAGELIPGNLYYSGQCWRSTYVYLGRNSRKEFLWYFIGNEEILKRSSAHQLLYSAEKTKQNKKVRPLHMALDDPKAYLYKEAKELIASNFRVNMSGITQRDLDMA